MCMPEVIGAQLVIDALKHEGIDTVYVLPGDPVGSIVNNAAAMGMRVISVRHEQVGTMAAQAHSYFTRTCGVVIAASGPAHTNTITGMAMPGPIVGRCWSSPVPPRTAGATWAISGGTTGRVLGSFCKWAYMVEARNASP
jgi:acetolactate synthase-1/2/3 large subunit